MKKLLLAVIVLFAFTRCVQTHHTNKPDNSEKSAQTQSPDAGVALRFINDYVANCNKMKMGKEIIEWAKLNPLVSKKFRAELASIVIKAQTKDPELGLDSDPIFDAQDYPEEGFSVHSVDPKTSYVVVKGIKWQEFKLAMKLRYLDNQWLVDGCGIVNIPKDKQTVR